jgi:RES domain-containing protein
MTEPLALTTSIFETYEAFNYFRRETFDRRFFRSEQSCRFLSGVLDTCVSRILTMPKGNVLFRAQLGHDWRKGDLGNDVPCPYTVDRMKPLVDRAHEGRVNPKGIPCLYLSSTREAAISEMRPGISVHLSVARMETVRDLKIIDCNKKHGAFVGLFPPPEGANIDDTVWATIDKAFGEPVVRVEDRADYAATQVIAELLRINKYNGIAYRSQFDPDGFNVALFDLDDAQQTECHLYRATDVKTTFDGPWDGYFNTL